MKRTVVLFLALAILGTAAVMANNPGHGGQVVVPTSRAEGSSLIKLLTQRYTKAELASGTYVGSEFCLSCHTSITPDTPEWRDTKHAYALRKPMGMYTLQPGKGVLATTIPGATQDDFMMGVDFNTKTGTIFDSTKPNAPILSYNASTDSYYIQLGPTGLKLLVAATWAGQSVGNGQRYMVRVPVTDTPTGYSNAIYFAPFSWGGTDYSTNVSKWYNGSTPKYAPGITTAALGNSSTGLQGQNYLATCAGCHITGVRKAWVAPSGEMIVNPYPASLVPDNSPNYPDLDGDGLPDLAGIGCESCHGPGSMHILGGGDPTKIINPLDIVAGPGYSYANQARSAVCLQCHVQIASAPTKKWGFPYDEVNNKPWVMKNPPDPLAQYQVFTGGKWPDGWNYVGARVDSYQSSGHFQGSHGIACNDCHDAHAETQNPAQVRDVMTRSGSTVTNAGVEDDSFCLSCHNGRYFLNIAKTDIINWKAAGFDAPIPDNVRNALETHTNHPYGAERSLGISRCTTCHMAPTAGHGTIEGSTHTFFPARPEDTINLATASGTGTTWGSTGNVNSCSSTCHRGKVILWSDVPANLTYNDNKFNTPNELKLANHLVQYFGPGGLWWNTGAAAASATPAP